MASDCGTIKSESIIDSRMSSIFSAVSRTEELVSIITDRLLSVMTPQLLSGGNSGCDSPTAAPTSAHADALENIADRERRINEALTSLLDRLEV